jgi:signal transduction histidine kinase
VIEKGLTVDLSDINKFRTYITDKNTELTLMRKVLTYAKTGNFTKYTSTLEEAWRVSIQGLTKSLCITLDRYQNQIPELTADMDYGNDPAAGFGIHEARLHRSRGVTIELFLALMKYYKQAYLDVVEEQNYLNHIKEFFILFIHRFFDHVEIGFSGEWAAQSKESLIKELQDRNVKMTNEKNKYLTIFESINTPVMIFNANGEFENANHLASNYFEGIVPPGSQYYSAATLNEKIDFLKADIDYFFKSSSKEWKIERNISTLKGFRHFEIKFLRMVDVSEKFNGATVLFNDITERVEFDNIRKQFISTVSHELRTPITSIDLSINILKKYGNQLSDDKRQGILKNLAQGANNLSRIVDDLLILSRVDSAKITLEISQVDLNELIQDVIKELEPRIYERNLKIDYKQSQNVIYEGDKFRLIQVLRIIIDNAIKYSSEHTEIKIELINNYQGPLNPSQISGVLINIQDQGIGISESDQKYLFERFFRSDAVSHIKGSGLGLSIAKEFVELHGGTISVESELQKGTIFHLFLPHKL